MKDRDGVLDARGSVALTVPEVERLFAFDDLDESGDWLALRLRIGPKHLHRDVSFRELSRFARGVALALVEQGCKSGERIALLMPHSKDLIVGFFGAIYAGLIPSIVAWPTVKMDSEKYERNVRAVVGNLKAKWLMTDPAIAHRLGSSLSDTSVLDSSIAETLPDSQVAMEAPRPIHPTFIQFSGGTTGTQKSVMISSSQLVAQINAYAQSLDLNRRDHVVSWLPLYHDMGLIACLLLPFCMRLPVTVFSPIEWVMDPRPFLLSIGEDRSTLCWMPNFALSFLSKRCTFPPGSLDLSSLRRVINCSEPVRAESMSAFRERFAPFGLKPEALHTCYAMAEATFAVTQSTTADPPKELLVSTEALGAGRLVPGGEAATRTLISCGRPLSNMAVRVVDPSGDDCDHRAIGEIWIKGASVMDDYLDATGGSSPAPAAFCNGWYCTGDLGSIVGGHLYVTGRKKDLIIVGGVNVYPEDIETAVGEVAGVHPGRVVAFGLSNEDSGTEQLMVVAERHDGSGGEAFAIESQIRASVLTVTGIAPFRVFVVPPKWVVKSTAGKISRTETRSRVLQHWDELHSKSAARGGEE